MMDKISNVLKESGEYSLTRLLSVVGFLAFLMGSFYLIIKGTSWSNYETFASLTGGGSAATQIANKLINSKFNTASGEVGKPLSKNEGDK